MSRLQALHNACLKIRVHWKNAVQQVQPKPSGLVTCRRQECFEAQRSRLHQRCEGRTVVCVLGHQACPEAHIHVHLILQDSRHDVLEERCNQTQ